MQEDSLSSRKKYYTTVEFEFNILIFKGSNFQVSLKVFGYSKSKQICTF